MPSEQQSSTTPLDERDSARTPRYLFEWLNDMFTFSIDLCASHDNALCPVYYTAEQDALIQPWHQYRAGFCNPPYSDTQPWMMKAIAEAAHGFTTVMVLPSPRGQLYAGSCLYGVASEIRHIIGRVSFLDPRGHPMVGNTNGTIVAVYRGHDLGHTRYMHITREEIEESGQRRLALLEGRS